MYIEPNTTIKILGDVRLKNDYKNTLRFENATTQYNYFNSKVIFGLTLTKQSYQRYDLGVITVNVDVGKLYSADYLMFQNTEFGNKWFYAFVNNVEYVSPNVSKIYYEVDILQSWWFNWQFGECFVERMHTPTDEVGEWLAEEPVTLCNPLVYTRVDFGFGNDFTYVVTCAFEIENISADPYRLVDMNGYQVYQTGSSRVAYPFKIYELTLEQYRKLVEAVYSSTVDRRSDVISVRIVPTEFTTLRAIDIADPGDLNDYYPNNKKLFTSQFRHLKATTGDVSKTYAYEFLNENGQFSCSFSPFEPDPCLILRPVNDSYKAHWCDVDRLYCSLVASGFTVDTFRSYFAEQMYLSVIPTGIETVSKLIPAMGGGIKSTSTEIISKEKITSINRKPSRTTSTKINEDISQRLPSGEGLIGDVIDVGTGVVKSYLAPNESVGGASGWSRFNLNDYPFCFYHVTIDYKDAKRLDAFLTAYGYQINEIVKPSVKTRERVNYLKTRGCNLINVTCPVDVQDAICAIFDAGVRVWQSPDYLNVYYDDNGTLLDNAPV